MPRSLAAWMTQMVTKKNSEVHENFHITQWVPNCLMDTSHTQPYTVILHLKWTHEHDQIGVSAFSVNSINVWTEFTATEKLKVFLKTKYTVYTIFLNLRNMVYN